MDNKSSHATAQPKGIMGPRGRISVEMVHNVLLVWLYGKTDEYNSNCQNNITQLRESMNDFNIFTDSDECVEFMIDMQNEKVCMVISETLAEQTVPCIHDLAQVDTILIYCNNKEYHEQWTKKWSKIKGVFFEITSICEAIKKTVKQCEQDSIPISFVSTTEDVSNKKLDQLEPSFMYTQIMKEILLTIKFEPKHIQEYISYCRYVFAKNQRELNKIDRFECEYRDKTSIWWYTYECFLYPMLNRALRLLDADIIVKMGFFISDLHRHIAQLHQQQFGGANSNNNFKVYRGQGMLTTDFEKLQQTKGGLLSFNNFLSTSKKEQVSLRFAQRGSINPDMVGILFVMTIHPSQSTTPFASINDVSAYGDKEDEVLFAMHTVFRIQDIRSMGGNARLFQVELTLTSDNDKDLHALTNRIREESCPDDEGWYRLGSVLWQVGQPQKAQHIYEILLEQETEESGKGPIYNQLGGIKEAQGEYQEAIAFYEKSLEIKKKILVPNDPDMTISYNNIGSVYLNMGEYPKALSSLKKALTIRQQSLPPNHPDLATSYSNIGSVYFNMGEYPKALSSYEKTLSIQQQSLPFNHPNLARSYNNIGVVYFNMGEYSKTLSYYEKSLSIQQQSLPPNHPNLASSYNNIGVVYKNMGEHSKTLLYYEKALAIQEQSLPSNHPDLALSYGNIGNMYSNMDEYSKARSYYEKAVSIQQQTLPSNHPDLASSYNNIGLVCFNMAEYPKALLYYEKALSIRQQSLPSNHHSLAGSYNNIGMLYEAMGKHSEALSSYEKTLAIKQLSLPSNHLDLASSYHNIGLVYFKHG